MSENTSNIPSAALARTEILKDGAAVIYGADATGGVVNFITRDDSVGLEVGARYKYIDGSDGDYGVSMLGGIGEGDTNFMWSLEYEHRSRLATEERDWASCRFTDQPGAVVRADQPRRLTPRGALRLCCPARARTAVHARQRMRALRSAAVRDNANASARVGRTARRRRLLRHTRACKFDYFPYYNLVEEQDIYPRLCAAQYRDHRQHGFPRRCRPTGRSMSPQVFGSPA